MCRWKIHVCVSVWPLGHLLALPPPGWEKPLSVVEWWGLERRWARWSSLCSLWHPLPSFHCALLTTSQPNVSLLQREISDYILFVCWLIECSPLPTSHLLSTAHCLSLLHLNWPSRRCWTVDCVTAVSPKNYNCQVHKEVKYLEWRLKRSPVQLTRGEEGGRGFSLPKDLSGHWRPHDVFCVFHMKAVFP